MYLNYNFVIYCTCWTAESISGLAGDPGRSMHLLRLAFFEDMLSSQISTIGLLSPQKVFGNLNVLYLVDLRYWRRAFNILAAHVTAIGPMVMKIGYSVRCCTQKTIFLFTLLTEALQVLCRKHGISRSFRRAEKYNIVIVLSLDEICRCLSKLLLNFSSRLLTKTGSPSKFE